MEGQLILVATPIGNLGDLAPRAAEALASCDFIAAEDTRVSVKLLRYLGIQKPLLSYFEHNRRERGEQIAARIAAGETCCLVTDAGMPAISDPGEDLVALCAARGITVTAIPGPSAFVTALALSGLPSGRFTFEGFLSTAARSRREHLKQIKGERRTIIFYEAPHKLSRTLQDLLEALGDRRVAVVREMTKIHEEVVRTTLGEACARYAETPPKGEIVLVIEGARESAGESMTLADAAEAARALTEGGLPLREAAREAARCSGLPKSEIYRVCIEESAKDTGGEDK